MRLSRRYKCPRSRAGKFWSKWNIFKVLLLLCIAGFAYIYLAVTPYSNQGILLELVNISEPITARKTYSPGANKLTSTSLRSALSTPSTTQLEINEFDHLSSSVATTASFGDISSLATAASVTEISSLATAASVTEISSLATATSVTDISNLATAASVTEISSLATATSVTDISSLATAASVTDISSLAALASVTDISSQATPVSFGNIPGLAIVTSVTDISSLATAASVTDISSLATATSVTDMSSLASAASVTEISSLTTAASVTEISILATAASVTDISSLAALASVTDISSQATAVSFGNIPSLAIVASVTDISSLATTVSVAAEKLNIETKTSVREILSAVTIGTAGEMPEKESTSTYSTVNPITKESTSDTTSIRSTTEGSTNINNALSISTSSSPTAEGASLSPSGLTGSPADIPTVHTQSAALEVTSAATAALSGNVQPLYVTSAFTGRLGNQMFIYAALIGIARAQNRTVFIKSGTDLEATFQITHLNDSIDSTGWENEGEAHYATFDPKFMSLTPMNKTFHGFFQSWRYFHHNQDEVRSEFKFKDEIFRKAQEHLQKFKNESGDNFLVGVHVRRGDYLNDNNVKLGYGVPQASYFHNAFKTIRELFRDKNVTFLIASDDLTWSKENLKDPDVRVVTEESPLVHFAVLANCDHVVLSGGTYGWWAAWLSPGVKIYYSKFVVNGSWLEDGFTREDYYPPDWIGLDNMDDLTSSAAASGLTSPEAGLTSPTAALTSPTASSGITSPGAALNNPEAALTSPTAALTSPTVALTSSTAASGLTSPGPHSCFDEPHSCFDEPHSCFDEPHSCFGLYKPRTCLGPRLFKIHLEFTLSSVSQPSICLSLSLPPPTHAYGPVF
ncbi:unnamed protein product [Lymnaea stagnalis]|uniref:L-Fucosyltransferase n=1 Tax=Lymnaea stagnalis TaxID=6523 RepID=A0AAV2HLR4_LYMST